MEVLGIMVNSKDNDINIVSKIIDDLSNTNSGAASSIGYGSIITSLLTEPLGNLIKILNKKENHSRNIEFKYLLNGLLNEKKLSQKAVYTSANLSKSYFFELLKGDKHPSRESTICLCFGFSLNLAEANLFLKNAGYNELYLRNIREMIIAKCLTKRVSLIDTNIILESKGYTILGK